MKLIGYNANGTDTPDPIYEIAGKRAIVPADTHPDDIELAVIEALQMSLELSDDPADVRALLERDDDSDVVSLLIDEILPFLEGRNFTPSARLTAMVNRRQQIRQRYPNGNPIPKPRKKDK